jgi:hypothetical protein
MRYISTSADIVAGTAYLGSFGANLQARQQSSTRTHAVNVYTSLTADHIVKAQ